MSHTKFVGQLANSSHWIQSHGVHDQRSKYSNTLGRFQIITIIFVEIDYLCIFDRRVATILNNLARESQDFCSNYSHITNRRKLCKWKFDINWDKVKLKSAYEPSQAGTYPGATTLYTWVERDTVRVKNTTQCPWPWLEPGTLAKSYFYSIIALNVRLDPAKSRENIEYIWCNDTGSCFENQWLNVLR